jgi:hypothetical protein
MNMKFQNLDNKKDYFYNIDISSLLAQSNTTDLNLNDTEQLITNTKEDNSQNKQQLCLCNNVWIKDINGII